MPDTQPAATTALTLTQTETTTRHGKRRCRHIRTAGNQCEAVAMNGQHYCFHHLKNRHPLSGKVAEYTLPFLDDTASIQLSVSRALQGLLDKTLDPVSARTALYGASIANATLRTSLMQQRFNTQRGHPAAPEPVSDVELVDFVMLAPDQEYRGPNNTFEPHWSLSKHMYEQECERLGIPKPTCAADYPADGWLTEEEMEEQKDDPSALVERYQARIAEFKKNREAVEAARAAANGSSPAQATQANSSNQPKPERSPEQRESPPSEPATANEPNAERRTLNAETDSGGPFKPGFGLSGEAPGSESCWCGGPDSVFPCHICRAKKEEAEKTQNPTNSAPGKGLNLNAAANQAVADRWQLAADRSSAPCTLHPIPCSPGTRQNLLLQKTLKTKTCRRPSPRGHVVKTTHARTGQLSTGQLKTGQLKAGQRQAGESRLEV
jgi:hypothetical protein